MPVKYGIAKIKKIALENGYRLISDDARSSVAKFIKRTVRIYVFYGNSQIRFIIFIQGEKPYNIPYIKVEDIDKLFKEPYTYERPR